MRLPANIFQKFDPIVSRPIIGWTLQTCGAEGTSTFADFFFGKEEYINIEMISVTPGLCNYTMPKRHYGCTQPTKREIEEIKRKVPL